MGSDLIIAAMAKHEHAGLSKRVSLYHARVREHVPAKPCFLIEALLVSHLK